MKIMICGSMTFAKEILEAKQILLECGHEAQIPSDTEMIVANPLIVDDFVTDKQHCLETDIMRECMHHVATSDGMVVLNHEKNGLPGYIGTATLMELGLAHYLHKKIFLLNPLPPPEIARWAHEVSIFQPEILHGDLSKIT